MPAHGLKDGLLAHKIRNGLQVELSLTPRAVGEPLRFDYVEAETDRNGTQHGDLEGDLEEEDKVHMDEDEDKVGRDRVRKDQMDKNKMGKHEVGEDEVDKDEDEVKENKVG